MFDGLKDKLGSFREDVEEQADVEEVDAEEGDADTADAEAAETPTGDDAEATGDAGESADTEETSADAGLTARAKALATGKVIIDEDDLEGPLWDLEMALLESDVEMNVAETILEDVKANLVGERKGAISSTSALVEDALRDALLDVISVGQFDFEQRIAEADKPVVIVFTGVNGVGKTTSIAKLSEWLDDRGFSSVLANGDTYRAGANEQIREHADALDRKLIAHEQGGDPAAVIYDGVEYAEANDIDVVLGDTAGRLHTSNDLMAQLEKIDRVVDPDMTLFVDEAVAGQDAVERAKQFDEAATIDGAILTKADADSNGGAAISIAHVTGKPILFLGTGQGYDDIQRFDPEQLVEQLLGD
jgi:fused signal recognition particle receptor